jgi:hypothetical protein
LRKFGTGTPRKGSVYTGADGPDGNATEREGGGGGGIHSARTSVSEFPITAITAEFKKDPALLEAAVLELDFSPVRESASFYFFASS